MTRLEYLALSDNEWNKGDIPNLYALTGLKVLSAWGCNLKGEIPDWIYSFTDLQILDLAENELAGEIDGDIGNLTGLQLLALGRNELSGTLPQEMEPPPASIVW